MRSVIIWWGVWGALALVGCDDGAPGGGAATPRDMGELGVCRFNSDCAPGYYCKARRCDLDCRTSRDCPAGQSCESGECLGAVAPDRGPAPDQGPAGCASDTACAPPDTICEAGACVTGCRVQGCAPGLVCGADTGRCAASDCRRDGCPDGEACDRDTGACAPAPACDPPCREDEYCDLELLRCALRQTCVDTGCPDGQFCDGASGQCLAPDCRRDGCLGAQVCNPQTGACEAPAFDCRAGDACLSGQRCDPDTGACVGRAAAGERCDRAFDCASDMCLSEPNTPEIGFCSQPCCSERECPDGFGCIYYAGIRACFPSRLFPTNNFNVPAGGPCGRGVNDCRTGVCDGERCLGSCCTDRDCLGATCELLPTGDGSARAVCDLGNFLGGPEGSICFGELDCINRLCMPHPDATPDNVFGYCAATCCTHRDCGGGFGCGQVSVGLDPRTAFITAACVPLTFGPAADGANCLADADCASGHCVEGACRQPCCFDNHCQAGERCLPRANGEGTLMRACVPPDVPDQD